MEGEVVVEDEARNEAEALQEERMSARAREKGKATEQAHELNED